MKKTVKILLCTVLLAACTVLLFGCAGEDYVPDGYMLASGDVNDFDLYVPKSWTVSLSDGTVAAYYSAADPSSVSVMPGGLEHADTTVDDWWEGYVSDFEKVYKDFALLSESDAEMGGENGRKYEYKGTLGDYTYRFELTAVIHEGNIYMFTYTSTEELFANHTDEVGKMIGYFSFR